MDETQHREAQQPIDVFNPSHRIAVTTNLLAAAYRFIYLVPHEDQDIADASLFQGASIGLVRTADLLDQALLFPMDVREICAPWTAIAAMRAVRAITPGIKPIQLSSLLGAMAFQGLPPFRCVLSNSQTVEFTDAALSGTDTEWLHLSTELGGSRLNVWRASRGDFKSYALRRLDALRGTAPESFIEGCRAVLVHQKLPRARHHPLRASAHNLTKPNEYLLKAFGCEMRAGPESPRHDEGAVEWIASSYDAARDHRKRLLPKTPAMIESNCLLLGSVGGYRFTRKGQNFNLRAAKDRRALRRTLKAMVRPANFVWYQTGPEFERMFNDPVCQAVVIMRKQELKVFTSTLTYISAGGLVPAIRLAPAVGMAYGTLKHLAECSRTPGPRKEQKLLRLFGAATQALAKGLPPELQDRVNLLKENSYGVKVASDLPIEWIPVNGVPLGLRHECSRIPVTPSNLAYATAINDSPVLVTTKQLFAVLVIRWFDEDDPIRNTLHSALRQILVGTNSPIRLTLADVDSPEAIVAALRAHDGAIVIFDCHSKFGDDFVSSLMIGGRAVSFEELRTTGVRLPPIVLLSSCDTLPVDGSHASPATGMFLLGAKSVLATLTPVKAIHEAVFLARLLFRIAEYISIMIPHRPTMTWRHVMSGMIKMQHWTEVLQTLVRRGHIPAIAYEPLQTQGNVAINSGDPNWIEVMRDHVARVTATDLSYATRIIDQASFTEAIRHVQLGNPESILIHIDVPLTTQPS